MEVVMNKDLKNICLIKTKKFKFVTIRYNFLSDLNYEDISSYNLLVALLTTRNNKYPTINEFNSYLESKYGMTITAKYFNRGNVSIFSIISSCMNSKFSLGENLLKEQFKLIKDCLFDPLFNDEVLNEIKTIYIERLKERLDKKTYRLKKKINSILGCDTPYGVNIEGDIESINSITLDKLKEVYNKLINSKCKIYICGEVNQEDLNDIMDDRLITNDEDILNLSYIKEIEKTDTNVFESDFLQSAISIIYQNNIDYKHPLYYAYKVFLEILNYDLFNIIREKYNFCYYVYAISNNYLNTMEIVSEIESKNLDKVVELVEEIIKGYDNDLEDSKFELSKNKLLSALRSSKESAGDLIDLYFAFDFNKTVKSYEEFYSKYESVTKDMVKDVSKMLSLKMVSILKEGNNNE